LVFLDGKCLLSEVDVMVYTTKPNGFFFSLTGCLRACGLVLSFDAAGKYHANFLLHHATDQFLNMKKHYHNIREKI
jgi:hypothetical protein